jgi:hypothetical protein
MRDQHADADGAPVDARIHERPTWTSTWKPWELERETRLELATCSLEGCRSTN